MMLDVVAEIKVEDIPNSQVVIGFLTLDELIVLGDDVDCGGMRANRTGARDEDKQESARAPIGIDQVVSGEDKDIVEKLLLVD